MLHLFEETFSSAASTEEKKKKLRLLYFDYSAFPRQEFLFQLESLNHYIFSDAFLYLQLTSS